MFKVEMADKILFLDDSGVDFTPFHKVAVKIDQCISLINYNKIFRNANEMAKKEEELQILRDEIKRIKKLTHR